MLSALPALRILAIFPVLNSLSTSLLFYWLIPNKAESLSLRVIGITGVINVFSIAFLGGAAHSSGAAVAVILTEFATLVGYLIIVRSNQPTARGLVLADLI